MKRYFILLFFAGVITFLGCIGAGTHGYLRAYKYNISKYRLEKAVHQVIGSNPSIYQDSIKSYYNDDTGYISAIILEKGLPFRYIFRFYGGKEYWDSSKTSEIFIAYAYDENDRGGSQGNGGVNWYNFRLKKRLTEPFEKELVNKVDSVLGIKHTEE
jgi:hypothetical protein